MQREGLENDYWLGRTVLELTSVSFLSQLILAETFFFTLFFKSVPQLTYRPEPAMETSHEHEALQSSVNELLTGHDLIRKAINGTWVQGSQSRGQGGS